VFAGPVSFEERDMEDVVDLPFPRYREADGQQGNDLFYLERTMIFVVQFLRRAARFDIASVEPYQVSYLVSWGFRSLGVCISLYPFLCFLQPSTGFVVYGVHPMGEDLAVRVEGLRRRGVHGYRVEAIVVSVERRRTIPRSSRVVVGEFRHWQQSHPIILFLAEEHSKVGFYRLVEPLRLSVVLWVERCGHPGPNPGES